MFLVSPKTLRFVSLIALGALVLASISCKDEFGTNLEKMKNRRQGGAQVGETPAPAVARLGFVITKVHHGQHPTDAAPWFAAGGDWTFLVAHVVDEPKAAFVLGYQLESQRPGEVGWANALLAVTSVRDGDHLLKALAAQLGGSLPPLADSDSIGTLRFRVEVLGQKLARENSGVFKGEGSWFHGRAIWNLRGYSGDLALNFSESELRGEWVEQDKRNRDALVYVASAALRDAPLPHGFRGTSHHHQQGLRSTRSSGPQYHCSPG